MLDIDVPRNSLSTLVWILALLQWPIARNKQRETWNSLSRIHTVEVKP
jgi:hypothetical protein